MLNFTAGTANAAAACQAATLTHIITSRSFIELAKLDPLIELLSQNYRIVYLEDIKANLSPYEKISALLSRPFIGFIHTQQKVKPDDAAVVLFTSGSEGTPKGVVLSHKNLIANRYQVGARLDFSQQDVVLNALPLFHSFGLTGGLLIPLLSGARAMLYPSPLHYRIVPLLAYDCNATILFGTDTFLTGYAKTAHPYDFYSLRYVCAGAERVKDETRKVYAEKFGVRILEGYGTTETAPVLAVNTPLYHKNGTVGRLLPAMKAKLTPVPGVAEGGRLSVTGPNVLMGYLYADKPGVLVPPTTDDEGRWHDTGDIVTIDEEGFIAIKGRAKRFAKIAGEMVSLAAVEDIASQAAPNYAHAVVSIADAKKGQALVLVTTCPTLTVEQLQDTIRQAGHTELMLPRRIILAETLPLLGSGKTDYVAVLALVTASA
jgi:acyl-[acyl-carrier-protein]-phospholipid O-acyltransferase/long-chain-fatty-acid--[acyl-carrier-protein] ligase